MGTLSTGSIVTFGDDNNADFVGLAPVTANKLITLHNGFDVDRFYSSAIDVTGLVVSVGSQTDIDSSVLSSSASLADICPATTTEAIIVYRADLSPNDDSRAKVLSVSGSTITANSHITLVANVSVAHISVDQLDTDKAICLHVNGNSPQQVEVFVITKSGTTLTKQTSTNIETGGSNAQCSIRAISATRAFGVWQTGSGLRVGLFSISGNTVTVEDTATIHASGTLGSARQKSIAAITSTKAVVCYRQGSGASSGRLIVVEDSSGTIVQGTPLTISSPSTPTQHIAEHDSDSILLSNDSSDELETYTVSGTTISADGNAISVPSTGFATIAKHDSAKWVGIGRNNDTDAFAFAAQEALPAKFYQGAGVLTEQFDIPFEQVETPAGMAVRGDGVVTIGAVAAGSGGEIIIQTDSTDYTAHTDITDSLTGVPINALKWINGDN